MRNKQSVIMYRSKYYIVQNTIHFLRNDYYMYQTPQYWSLPMKKLAYILSPSVIGLNLSHKISTSLIYEGTVPLKGFKIIALLVIFAS